MTSRQATTAILLTLTVILGSSSIWMVSKYLNLYRTTMKTEVNVEIANIDLNSYPRSMQLIFKITSPVSRPFDVHLLFYEVNLNGKHLTQETIRGTFQVGRDINATIERITVIPEARMFTIHEAEREEKWLWRISGSLHMTSYLGETRIRFSSDIDFEPD